MSPAVGASRTRKRAKCRRSNRPKGTRAFSGSTTPGRRFIEARRERRSPSRSSATGARTMKLDCGVIAIVRRPLELQCKIDQSLPAPVHLAQIQARTDLADLVPDPLRDEGGVGVVENDALLAIQPAVFLVDPGNDGAEAERQD